MFSQLLRVDLESVFLSQGNAYHRCAAHRDQVFIVHEGGGKDNSFVTRIKNG